MRRRTEELSFLSITHVGYLIPTGSATPITGRPGNLTFALVLTLLGVTHWIRPPVGTRVFRSFPSHISIHVPTTSASAPVAVDTIRDAVLLLARRRLHHPARTGTR